MTDHATFLSRLEDVHEFPCDFVIKVIGINNTQFVTRVIQASVNALGYAAEPGVETRESSGGKHVSITLTLSVQRAEEVIEVYTLLNSVEGVRFLL
jgi:putative lipoic acid-binding regulatory protein